MYSIYTLLSFAFVGMQLSKVQGVPTNVSFLWLLLVGPSHKSIATYQQRRNGVKNKQPKKQIAAEFIFFLYEPTLTPLPLLLLAV